MALQLNLRESYLAQLSARSLPPEQLQQHEAVFLSLCAFLQDRPAAQWRHQDLELFRRSQGHQNAGVDTTIDMVSKIIDRAAQRGLHLTLGDPNSELTDEMTPGEREARAAAKAIGLFRQRSAPRPAKKSEEELSARRAQAGVAVAYASTPSPPQSPAISQQASSPALPEPAPQASQQPQNSKPNSPPTHTAPPSPLKSAPASSSFEPAPKLKPRTPTPPQSLQSTPPSKSLIHKPSSKPKRKTPPDDAFGTRCRGKGRVARSKPVDQSSGVYAGFSAGLLQGNQVEDQPSTSETNTIQGLEDNSSRAAPSDAFSSPLIDKINSEAEAFVARADARQTSPEAAQKPSSQILIPALDGWLSPFKTEAQDDGTLLVDNRFALGGKLPAPANFAVKHSHQSPSSFEEFFNHHRIQPIVIAVALFISLITFFAHWPTALLFTLISSSAAAAFIAKAWFVDKYGKTTPEQGDPEAVTRAYVGAVRTSLFHRARRLMALPNNTKAVTVQELRHPGRDLLGVRFNTLSPALLGEAWSKRTQVFMSQDAPIQERLLEPILTPERVELETILVADKKNAAVLALRGPSPDEYMLIHTVQLDGLWYIANGECALRSSKLEALGRLAHAHAQGRISDDIFKRAFHRNNITQDVVQAALAQSILDPSQVKLLEIS